MIIKKLLKDLNMNNVIGDLHRQIDGVASLSNAARNKLVYCNSGMEYLLRGISDCVVIVSVDAYINALPDGNTYVLVDNPRLAFIHAVNMLYAKYLTLPQKPAIIHESAQIYQPYIGYNCSIGRNVTIHPHVTILCNTVIEENVTIYPNTAIGSIGFGQERNEHRELVKFPHLGGVHIHKNVEIGSNVAIDRGTLDDTVIDEGTMIDNLVHISHNCKIGKHCSIASGTEFGGGTILGDHATVATGVVTRDGGITIGKNAFVGLGSVVTKDIPDNMTVMGVPAREINEFKRYLKFVKDNANKR